MDGYNNTLALTKLLDRVSYKENWSFEIHHWMHALLIGLKTVDSTGQHDPYYQFMPPGSMDRYNYGLDLGFERHPFMVVHRFIVPQHKMDEGELERWVLECIINVETHEAMEFFKVDGLATFFPDHEHPYRIERKV